MADPAYPDVESTEDVDDYLPPPDPPEGFDFLTAAPGIATVTTGVMRGRSAFRSGHSKANRHSCTRATGTRSKRSVFGRWARSRALLQASTTPCGRGSGTVPVIGDTERTWVLSRTRIRTQPTVGSGRASRRQRSTHTGNLRDRSVAYEHRGRGSTATEGTAINDAEVTAW